MTAPFNFAIRITSTDTVTLVSAAGEIDGAVSEDLRSKLGTAVGSGLPVIVDLSEVIFCDSSGLTALIHGHTAAETAGTKFVIATRQRAVLRPIALLGLTDLLQIEPDVEAARVAIGLG